MCTRQRKVPIVKRVLHIHKRAEQVLTSLDTAQITVAGLAIDALVYGFLPNSPLLLVLRLYSAKVTEIWCRRVWEDLVVPTFPKELRNLMRDANNAVEQRLVDLLNEHLDRD